ALAHAPAARRARRIRWTWAGRNLSHENGKPAAPNRYSAGDAQVLSARAHVAAGASRFHRVSDLRCGPARRLVRVESSQLRRSHRLSREDRHVRLDTETDKRLVVTSDFRVCRREPIFFGADGQLLARRIYLARTTPRLIGRGHILRHYFRRSFFWRHREFVRAQHDENSPPTSLDMRVQFRRPCRLSRSLVDRIRFRRLPVSIARTSLFHIGS